VGLLSRKKVAPRTGDTIVTLTVSDKKSLEERMYLLSYAFAKVVQGTVLKRVLVFNLKDGIVKFIVGDAAGYEAPSGELHARLEHFDVDKDLEELFNE
jgi:hypothetical protein